MDEGIKYYALIKQAGEGCDYMIACGYHYVEILGAIDLHSAKQVFEDMMFDQDSLDYKGYDGKRALEEAIIISVAAEEKLDLDSIYQRQQEFKDFEKKQAKEEKEREEYERLKSKFEKNN